MGVPRFYLLSKGGNPCPLGNRWFRMSRKTLRLGGSSRKPKASIPFLPTLGQRISHPYQIRPRPHLPTCPPLNRAHLFTGFLSFNLNLLSRLNREPFLPLTDYMCCPRNRLIAQEELGREKRLCNCPLKKWMKWGIKAEKQGKAKKQQTMQRLFRNATIYN